MRERKHNKIFNDNMKKIDKECVEEIEKNKHLTGEDYANSVLEDMDESEIRCPFLNWLRLSRECNQNGVTVTLYPKRIQVWLTYTLFL